MENLNTKPKRTNIFAPTDSGLAVLLALVVPQILIYIVLLALGKEAASSTLASALVPQISFAAVFVFLAERKKINYKTGAGFNFKIDWLILIVVLLIGVFAMFGFTSLVNLFDYLTAKAGYKSGVSIDVSTVSQLLLSILYVGLLPAICEELVFRGVVTNGLKKYGMITAIIISAVFFALIHQNLQQLIYQLFLGGVMAFIMLKTGSIIYTMCLHFFNNTIILVMAHLSGDSGNVDYTDPKFAEYYSNAWNIIWPILVAIAAIGAVVGLLFLMNYLQNRRNKKLDIVAESAQTELGTQNSQTQQEVKLSVETKTPNIESEAQEIPQKTLFKDKKFYQNPIVISALVVALMFWIYAVIVSFKG